MALRSTGGVGQCLDIIVVSFFVVTRENSMTQACVRVQLKFLGAPRAKMARTLLLTLSALVVLSSAHLTPKKNMPHGKDGVARFLRGANRTRLEKLAGKKNGQESMPRELPIPLNNPTYWRICQCP